MLVERGVNPEKASQGNGSLNILRDAESEDPVALGGRTSNPYLMPQQPSGVPRNANTQQVFCTRTVDPAPHAFQLISAGSLQQCLHLFRPDPVL